MWSLFSGVFVYHCAAPNVEVLAAASAVGDGARQDHVPQQPRHTVREKNVGLINLAQPPCWPHRGSVEYWNRIRAGKFEYFNLCHTLFLVCHFHVPALIAWHNFADGTKAQKKADFSNAATAAGGGSAFAGLRERTKPDQSAERKHSEKFNQDARVRQSHRHEPAGCVHTYTDVLQRLSRGLQSVAGAYRWTAARSVPPAARHAECSFSVRYQRNAEQ